MGIKKPSLRARHVAGFTLLEIVIVTALTAILGTAAVMSLPTVFRSTTELDAAAKQLQDNLVGAQQNAQSQYENSAWGVYLNAATAGSHYYKVFYGDSYATGTVTDTVYLPKSVEFLTPAQGNTEEIDFPKVTGIPAVDHGVTLALTIDTSIVRYISVLSGSGLITTSKSASGVQLTMSLSPTTATIQAGGSTQTTATVNITAGIPHVSTFSVSNLPSGVNAIFNPATCTPNCTATLNLTTSLSTPAGSVTLPVQIGDGTATTTANFILTVNTTYVPVSGFAWSSNSGWISFNCSNTTTCGTVNYGVNADASTGILNGYAWSPTIGWIDFNQNDLTGCPSGNCVAQITNGLAGPFPTAMTGWGKIISTGSWLHLSGTAQNASAYGVSLAANGTLSGWGWDSTTLGWLSFNCSNTSVCGSVSYGARVN